ncbi:DUF1259 domain-containing protein [Streptomyces corynorhini]|uniref:DUF1259 domain-containing protein n=1 Tax=Streptomyces corynorhini TaxID=2282652 RepID=A0A370AZU5_9ACTN|nr:DUF1259 domain-containing protein [Streptomyces corynorhini]RDG33952.1 DUF1259 domain-containing protein [Streptomyces corynorhini]
MKRESQDKALPSLPQGGPVDPPAPDKRTGRRGTTPRRRLLAAAALAPLLAPVLTGVGVGTARARSGPAPEAGAGAGARAAEDAAPGGPVQPVPTTVADWKGVARALGRSGSLVRGLFYHTRFPRGDLHVVTRGVTVSPGLALGSHMAFVRYADGTVSAMGDLNVTEGELQRVTDSLFQHGIEVTALHKHLLAHTPDVWWIHIHAHGTDPVPLARGLRAAIGRTASPPAMEPGPPPPLDLDLAGMEAALGVAGSNDGGIYKSVFARRETVIHDGRALPRGLAATSAFNFQPLGGGRAAVNGDFAMVADEVQPVLSTLRRGGIELVELHNHGLTEEPRLFFAHFWAVDDAVRLARALRPAVDATNVAPVSMTGGSERVGP